jgi:superfamily I DNA and/or RNA helicase
VDAILRHCRNRIDRWVRSAIDTVERFQGGERTVIMVSATESDRAYLLASSEFLLDPRRLTVALSRAKRKMVLVAARSIFSLFSPDEETFTNSLLWKNLLLRSRPVVGRWRVP